MLFEASKSKGGVRQTDGNECSRPSTAGQKIAVPPLRTAILYLLPSFDYGFVSFNKLRRAQEGGMFRADFNANNNLSISRFVL